MRGVIALLTDFGTRDGFVGAMKGAALAVEPGLSFVDISHEIEPQGVLEGALVLSSVFDVFPRGTVFVAVVDPGVGTERAVIAARTEGRTLLAPDNGLLAPLLEGRAERVVHAVDAPRFARGAPHPTFHGRDLFAPVAARLAQGTAVEDLGPARDRIEPLSVPRPRREGTALVGEILHVDRFGNLVTNLDGRALAEAGGASARFEIAGESIAGISETYGAGPPALLAVVGSWGYVEISLRGGSAARSLTAGKGTAIRARLGAGSPS